VIAPRLLSARQIAILGGSAPASVFSSSGKRMFSTQHTIEEESAFMARKLTERGHKRVVIVFYDNEFSRAHEAAFRKNFSGEILETIAMTDSSGSDQKAIALKIKRLAPDAVYMPDAFPILQGFGKELVTMKLQTIPVYGVYSFQTTDVADILPKDISVTYSYPDIGDEDALVFFSGLAGEIIKDALATCGAQPDCIQEQLLNTGRFSEQGSLKQGFVLKEVRDGKFQRLEK
jgi:ABC-type branched-subunit amino acid transport system substrate-binding protein